VLLRILLFVVLACFLIISPFDTWAFDVDPLIDTPGKTVGSDFNGDGIHDLIIGADAEDTGGNSAGTAYIFFGATDIGGTKLLGGAQSADVSIIGKLTGDALGRSVGSAGDVNGDGIDDIIVGAGTANVSAFDEGEVYIFFGATNLSGTKLLGGAASADVTIQGKGGTDNLGVGVSGGACAPPHRSYPMKSPLASAF